MVEIAQLQVDRKKVGYAKEVAEKLTQEEFEKEMPILYQALSRCNELAFNPK
jgi:hypothetical protein